jgi:hypothetical protein
MASASSSSSSPSPRRAFTHEGRVIYEWEQGLDEVLVYITPPPGARASMLVVSITPSRVAVGVKGVPPYLEEELASTCVAKESLWTLDDGVLQLTLVKARKAETWACVFKGHEAGAAETAAALEADKRRILLERFQEENPGFDFSQAEVNGQIPDPRTFMGGPSTK